MKHLHDPARVAEVKSRLAQLRTDSQRQWGKMTAPQAVAHMSVAFEAALGDVAIKRLFIGRLIGGFVKKSALGNDAPIMKNAPTAPEYLVVDQRDLDRERDRLRTLIDRFAVGPSVCTTQPHAFFGPLTADEWAILMYKHVDHHLRQFGV